METQPNSPSREFIISNKLGLHARPAAMFVKTASRFPCEIWVDKDGEQVNGKSIMGLMMLAAARGARLIVSAEGEEALEALAAIEELITSGFQEDS
jgi:phosphocarrier protein HPr